ncbi:hypothetical protein HOH45_05955 [bacterium]|jgi:predicted nuclease of restriction endonuclease-like (RecB) superfamily|nr:hypothetical protein [bacterium]
MTLPSKNLFHNIKSLLQNARSQVVRAVNTTMVHTYFEIGRLIVEHEQKGNVKAKYGAEILQTLSIELTTEFGKGFTKRNLELMRQFYIAYGKTKTLSSQSQGTPSPSALSWSHYIKLMRISNPQERQFYETETIKNN